MALNVPKFDNPLHKRILLAILLVVAVFVAYWPCLQGEFICDDNDDVVNNLALRTWDGLVSLWTTPGVTAQYYPLTFTSFWLNYQWGGLDPLGYHLVNVMFHALNALLLWAVLRRLQIPGAWLGAALWALHPVNVESVAYIDERKNVLSGFFFLLSLWFAIRFWLGQGTRLEAGLAGQSQGDATSSGFARLVDPLVIVRSTCPSDLVKLFERFYFSQGLARIMAQWGGFWSRVSAMRAYILALVCFALALLAKTAVLPLPAVILLLVWWRRKPTLRDALFLLPMVVMGVGLSLVTLHLEHHLVVRVDLWHLSWPQRFILAGRAIWFYLGKLIWPHPLIFWYPRWTLNPSDVTQYLPLASAIIVAGFLIWKRKGLIRPVAVALAFFVLMLFLILGFFNLNIFRYTFVSDHFQYLACASLIFLFTGVCSWASRWRESNFLSKMVFIVLIALLSFAGYSIFKLSGDYQYEEGFWKACLAKNPQSAMADVSLGNYYFLHGQKTVLAIPFDQKAIALDPRFFEAWNNLGVCLAYDREYDKAEECFQKALEINPGFGNSAVVLSALYQQQGKYGDAIAVLTDALKHTSETARLENELALLMATCPDPAKRNGQQALKLAEDACSFSNGGNAKFLATKALAYAECGDFKSATDTIHQARDLAAKLGQADEGLKDIKLIQLFENHQPYHSSSFDMVSGTMNIQDQSTNSTKALSQP